MIKITFICENAGLKLKQINHMTLTNLRIMLDIHIYGHLLLLILKLLRVKDFLCFYPLSVKTNGCLTLLRVNMNGLRRC